MVPIAFTSKPYNVALLSSLILTGALGYQITRPTLLAPSAKSPMYERIELFEHWHAKLAWILMFELEPPRT